MVCRQSQSSQTPKVIATHGQEAARGSGGEATVPSNEAVVAPYSVTTNAQNPVSDNRRASLRLGDRGLAPAIKSPPRQLRRRMRCREGKDIELGFEFAIRIVLSTRRTSR